MQSDSNLPKCFICDGAIPLKDEYQGTVVAQTVMLSVAKILEMCLQHLFTDIDNEYFCPDCIQKIQQYDQLAQLSKQIESELFEAYQRKSLNNYFIVEDTYDDDDDADDGTMEMNAAEEVILEDVENDAITKRLVQCEEDEDEEEEEEEEEEEDEAEGDVLEEDDAHDTENIIQSSKNVKLEIEHVLPTVGEKYSTRSQRNRTKIESEEVKPVKRKANKTQKLTKREYKCPTCKATCRNRSDRSNHIKTVHGGEKCELVCDICGQPYKSKRALDIHVDMHKGISPHECNICGKKFTQKGALVRHMPLHTGEKPYQCDKCGKQFIHYSSFHMHQLAHNNIREKKCDICGLELLSSSHLSRHMRVHTGEKPYECPICNQRFAQRYNMTTHVKAHQGIHRPQRKSITCPICNETFNRKEKLKAHLTSQHGTVATTATDTISSKQPQSNASNNGAIIVVEKSAPIATIEVKTLNSTDSEYVLPESVFC